MGCGSASLIHVPTPMRVASSTAVPAPNATITFTPMPLPTRLVEPRRTPSPTASATFDFSHSRTRTPAPPAACPVEKPALKLELKIDPQMITQNIKQPVLDFLNKGGTRPAALEGLAHIGLDPKKQLLEQDFTGDGIPELLIVPNSSFIYSCQGGTYRVVFVGEMGYAGIPIPGEIRYVQDLNLDGVPEIVMRIPNLSTNYYEILEWNGDQFINLIAQPDFISRYIGGGVKLGQIYMSGSGQACWRGCVRDQDGNGTLEFIVDGGVHEGEVGSLAGEGPWRVETLSYAWNGAGFVLDTTEIAAPQFRFQAIQDADEAALRGQFDKALALYQQAIFDEKLDWYSEERYFWQNITLGETTPTIPLPSPDPNEYPNLAAYAYYRIVLLDVQRGELQEAQATYGTLQQTYGGQALGRAYAALATAFFDDYLIAQDMGHACSKAIEYATLHSEEILIYPGSGYHGWQSRIYRPEDICPFK